MSERLKLGGVDMGEIVHKRTFDGWTSWFCEQKEAFNNVLNHKEKGSRVFVFRKSREDEALEVFWEINGKSIDDVDAQTDVASAAETQ